MVPREGSDYAEKGSIMLSQRHGIELHHVMQGEIDSVDTLFENCDAEFNSRADVHSSFERETSSKRWARYYLSHEVTKVAIRDGIPCSNHLSHIVANEIAGMWFGCSKVN